MTIKISIVGAWLITILGLISYWPLAIVGICLVIYISIKNRNVKKTAEHQREIERKEIDMVRKSNDILIHLIQDEHRGEDR